jgi:hypothetical protein
MDDGDGSWAGDDGSDSLSGDGVDGGVAAIGWGMQRGGADGETPWTVVERMGKRPHFFSRERKETMGSREGRTEGETGRRRQDSGGGEGARVLASGAMNCQMTWGHGPGPKTTWEHGPGKRRGSRRDTGLPNGPLVSNARNNTRALR